MALKPTHHVCYNGTHHVEIYIYPPDLQAANSGNNDARRSIIAAINAALKELKSDVVVVESASNWRSKLKIKVIRPTTGRHVQGLAT